MADFDVSYVGDDPQAVADRLDSISLQTKKRTNQELKDTAEEIKDELEDTSPVDSGEYQDSWYVYSVDYDEVWILNEADHAKFVMMPNEKMRGSASADVPSMGILHNVKGIARGHSESMGLDFSEAIQNLIDSFRVRR